MKTWKKISRVSFGLLLFVTLISGAVYSQHLPKVLLLHTDWDNTELTDIQTRLRNSGQFSQVDDFDGGNTLPTISYLRG